MLGFPKGPLQFEDDLAQVRDDIFWLSQFGPALMNIMIELRNIRRLMEIQMGEQTREDVQKEVEEDKKEFRAFERENEKRMDLRKG